MVTIAYIEEEVARRIAQLDTSAYRQAPGETWRESPMPLTASRESALKAHMLFSASVEGVDARGHQDFAGDEVACSGELAVLYRWRIRPAEASQLSDYRAASEAARAIAGCVLALWPMVNCRPLVLWSPGPTVDGFMTVALRFAVDFTLSISPVTVPNG